MNMQERANAEAHRDKWGKTGWEKGTVGSVVLECSIKCPNSQTHRQRFRDPALYFRNPPEWEVCFDCGSVMTPIEPEREGCL